MQQATRHGSVLARALVIGGTGPTGPSVVNGLIKRGFKTTILHTGRHESDAIPPSVEHIHSDPFRVADVRDALGDSTFDVVCAMYGRLRDLAPYFAGRCRQFIAVGGLPAYRGYARPELNWPTGMLVPIRENADRAHNDESDKVAKIVETEDIVLASHPNGTIFRYPLIYGPGQIYPREWLIVRRILDGRRRIVVADGGLTLRTAAYGPNAGHALTLAVDRPGVAAGKTYNVSDEHTLTVRQTIEVIAAALDAEIEIVSLPEELATPARPFLDQPHSLHRYASPESVIAELGYRDRAGVVDAVGTTARHLAQNPMRRGSTEERRLQDPFDYEAEDAIIDAYRSAVGRAAELAAEYDPEFHGRHHPEAKGRRFADTRN